MAKKVNSYPAINYPTIIPYLGCSTGDFIVLVAIFVFAVSIIGFVASLIFGWKGYLYSILIAVGLFIAVTVFIKENRKKIPKTHEVLYFSWNFKTRKTYLCGFDGEIEHEEDATVF